MKKLIVILFLITLLIPVSLTSYTGETVLSYDTPGQYPTGLAFDGKNLWLADRKTGMLYSIDPANGKVLHNIEAPGFWPQGLAWDGEALWNADVKGGLPLSENYNGKIYRIDPKDGTLLKTIPAPCKSPRGLTWDGKYLWCVDNMSDELICFSPDDGTTIKSFKSPSSEPHGLTFDGKYLWVSDRGQDEIYMVDTQTGNVIIIADAPGPYARGLAFDGKFLWAVDSQNKKLYKLKIRDSENFRRSSPKNSLVTYNHKTRNYGPGNVQALDVHIAIPVNRDNQEITSKIQYTHAYTDIITDKWGQNTAHYNYKKLKSGTTKNIEMTTEVTIYDVRYFIYPENVGTLSEIPADIKSKYLEDNEKYQLNHPVIQNAISAAVGDEQNPYRIFRKIFDYLIKNMYYEMSGGWNTAPAVLARGNGSCSEYSFVYISMCRAAGLPARYVGAVVIRGDDACTDDVFHRWVEVYLPNYGWIPIDPSGGDQAWPRGQANSIGHVANRYLITTQSGGGSETMAWTYNSNEFFITDPKTFVVFDTFADWQPAK
ncbi:transglutaminase domain-containing protein [Bacteroidota bacterium]